MIAMSLRPFQFLQPFKKPVILSEAKDLRRQHDRLFTIEHDHVRAQHRSETLSFEGCAPACPGVNFTHALFLIFSSDRTL